MTEKPPITALAQFFDDIRMEVNGKTILIGQYNGDLILPQGTPMMVDRLAILLTARWPRDYVPKELGFKISIPGQPQIDQPLAPLPTVDFSDRPVSDFSGVMIHGAIQLRFAPLRVGDTIEVWLKADGHDLPAGRLTVTDKSFSQLVGSPKEGMMAVTVF